MNFKKYLSQPAFSVFSDELKVEIINTISLQEILFSLSDNNFNSVINYILHTEYIYSSEGIFGLTHEILITAIYRPKLQKKVVLLIVELLKHGSEDNKLSEIKVNIANFFSVESIHGSRYFFFFSECFRNGVLTEDDLRNSIDDMINAQSFLSFCWFSPLIYNIDR